MFRSMYLFVLQKSRSSRCKQQKSHNGYLRINSDGSAVISLSSFGNVDAVFVTGFAVGDNTRFFIGISIFDVMKSVNPQVLV